MTEWNCPWCDEGHESDQDIYRDEDEHEEFCQTCGRYYTRYDHLDIHHTAERTEIYEEIEPCRDKFGDELGKRPPWEGALPCIYCEGLCLRHLGQPCACSKDERHLTEVLAVPEGGDANVGPASDHVAQPEPGEVLDELRVAIPRDLFAKVARVVGFSPCPGAAHVDNSIDDCELCSICWGWVTEPFRPEGE